MCRKCNWLTIPSRQYTQSIQNLEQNFARLAYVHIVQITWKRRRMVAGVMQSRNELCCNAEAGTPWFARRYPTKKEEQWWLVVGDPKANTLLAIKRISLQRKSKVKLAFQAPSKMATHHLVLYFMCDSYMGCDQVLKFSSPFVKLILTTGCNIRALHSFLVLREYCPFTIKNNFVSSCFRYRNGCHRYLKWSMAQGTHNSEIIAEREYPM